MQINWSVSPENDLDIIYQFYLKTSNKRLAKKIIKQIINATSALKLGLFIGQLEPLLCDYEEGHRYLICNHNNFIYTINYDCVIITHVFDTRRNPLKLEKR